MSFFTRVFGKNKSSVEQPTTLPEAIQKLKQTEEMLLKKQNYLETRIKKETSNAKNLAQKNKKAALEALQKKKRYERQLQQIDGVLTKIEAQIDIAERANANSVVVGAMKQATDALKAAQNCLSTEQVEKILDDLADQRDITEDISNAISQPVAGFDAENLDEDELEKELQLLELEDREISSKLLPNVPTQEIDAGKSINKSTKTENVGVKLLA